MKVYLMATGGGLYLSTNPREGFREVHINYDGKISHETIAKRPEKGGLLEKINGVPQPLFAAVIAAAKTASIIR